MRPVIFFLAVVIVTGLSVAMKWTPNHEWEERDNSEFIKFSHTFHVKGEGIGCSDCHHSAKTSGQSSDNLIGDHESCSMCHEADISGNCGFCHVDPSDIVPIPNPERELIFSHERHLSDGAEVCENCHKGVGEATYATSLNMPAMSLCVDCHTGKNAARECGTCHTDYASLLPDDHLNWEFKTDHKRLTRLGEHHVTCSACHTESFCQNCHSGIELKEYGIYGDLIAGPSPGMQQRDTPRELKLQNVHNLNYLYTHGIDARSRAVDCYTCHDRHSFCVECHSSGGDLTDGRIRPQNHDEPGFKTIGKNSGGGRHAEYAVRDIEYCMSCHDVEGSDPVCMVCHKENGGVW